MQFHYIIFLTLVTCSPHDEFQKHTYRQATTNHNEAYTQILNNSLSFDKNTYTIKHQTFFNGLMTLYEKDIQIITNTLLSESIQHGRYRIISNFNLVLSNDSNTIINKNGYNTIIILEQWKLKKWQSQLTYGSEKWIEVQDSSNLYMLIKETDHLLKTIFVNQSIKDINTYTIKYPISELEKIQGTFYSYTKSKKS